MLDKLSFLRSNLNYKCKLSFWFHVISPRRDGSKYQVYVPLYHVYITSYDADVTDPRKQTFITVICSIADIWFPVSVDI